jgi:hypothetical protein
VSNFTTRIEDLAYAIELVGTDNQNNNSLGVRLRNPGCLKFSNWQKEYGAVPGTNGFARFPTYGLGKKRSFACCVRNERKNANVQRPRDDQAIYLSVREFLAGKGKGKLRPARVRGSPDSFDNYP